MVVIHNKSEACHLREALVHARAKEPKKLNISRKAGKGMGGILRQDLWKKRKPTRGLSA